MYVRAGFGLLVGGPGAQVVPGLNLTLWWPKLVPKVCGYGSCSWKGLDPGLLPGASKVSQS